MEKTFILIFILCLFSCSKNGELTKEVNLSEEEKLDLKIFIESNKPLMDSIEVLPKLNNDSVYVCSTMEFNNCYRIQLMKYKKPFFNNDFKSTYIYTNSLNVNIIITGFDASFKKMNKLSADKYDFITYKDPYEGKIKDIWGFLYFYVCKKDNSIVKVYTAKENDSISFADHNFIKCP
jgi:hypothetical protein